jgi:hypothetical protein
MSIILCYIIISYNKTAMSRWLGSFLHPWTVVRLYDSSIASTLLAIAKQCLYSTNEVLLYGFAFASTMKVLQFCFCHKSLQKQKQNQASSYYCTVRVVLYYGLAFASSVLQFCFCHTILAIAKAQPRPYCTTSSFVAFVIQSLQK